jgi:hypothetical protein
VTCWAVQTLESQSDSEGVGFVVCQIVWKCIWQYGYKEKTYRDITELILVSDCDAHSSEYEDISAQSDSETDNNTDDVSDTNFTQQTDNINCRPTVPVIHKFTGVPSGLRHTEAPPHH